MTASPELQTGLDGAGLDVDSASADELEAALRGSDQSDARYLLDGRMLRALRDRKLWRELGHESFKAWCQDRWRSGRADAYARIAGALLAEQIRAAGEERVPANLSQARALTESKLGPERQREAWSLALERFGDDDITADRLRTIAAELRADDHAPARATRQEDTSEPRSREQEIEDLVFECVAAAVRAAGKLDQVLPPATLGGFVGGVQPGQPETYLAWWRPMLELIAVRARNGGDPVNRLRCDLERGELSLTLPYPDVEQRHCAIKVELRAYMFQGAGAESKASPSDRSVCPQSTDTVDLEAALESAAGLKVRDLGQVLAAVFNRRPVVFARSDETYVRFDSDDGRGEETDRATYDESVEPLFEWLYEALDETRQDAIADLICNMRGLWHDEDEDEDDEP